MNKMISGFSDLSIPYNADYQDKLSLPSNLIQISSVHLGCWL